MIFPMTTYVILLYTYRMRTRMQGAAYVLHAKPLIIIHPHHVSSELKHFKVPCSSLCVHIINDAARTER